MPRKRNWTRSICPICGREFPQGVDEDAKTCGRADCLQEAIKREPCCQPRKSVAFNDNSRMFGELARVVDTMRKAGDELLIVIKEDSKIAENMRDVWKNQGVND